MHVETESGEHWEKLIVSGAVTGEDAAELEQRLQRFLTLGRYHLILDMSGLEYIASAGISALLRVTRACRRWQQGDLYLAHVPEEVLRLFHMIGLIGRQRPALTVVGSVEEAVSQIEGSSSGD